MKKIYLLVLINWLMAAGAWIYDWPKLVQIPLWSWPLLLICPLYPFFLGGYWLLSSQNRPVPNWLLGVSAIPSLFYGLLSLVYYPSLMIITGFSWWLVGQIGWVWIYAGQGIYLLLKHPLSPTIIKTVSLFLLASIFTAWKTSTYGYFDTISLGQVGYNSLHLLALLILFLLVTTLLHRFVRMGDKLLTHTK